MTSEETYGDFPGGPVVKTRVFTARGTGSLPGPGTKIPNAVWSKNKLRECGKQQPETGRVGCK